MKGAISGAACLVAVTGLVAVTPAQASFPGTNGRIAYASGGNIFILTPGSSAPPVQVTANGDGVSITNTSPTWNPSPRLSHDLDLAFVSDQAGNNDIYAVNSSRAAAGQVDLTPGAAADDFAPAFSPTGTRLTWSRDFRRSRPGTQQGYPYEKIVSATFNRLGTLGLPRNLTSLPDAREFTPSYSPDGRQIAFSSNLTEGGNWDIFVIDDSGGNVRNVTNTPDTPYAPPYVPWEFEPDFSPDGRTVVYRWERLVEGRGFYSDIVVRNADGSNPVNLTNGFGDGEVLSPTFSPDGKQIAFAGKDGGDFDIFSMNVDGSNKVNQTPGSPADDFNPDWEGVRKCGGRRVTISGSEGPDRIMGTKNRDVVSAGGGRDVVRGAGGNDLLCGGPGRDKLIGDEGKNDRCVGGKGNDQGDGSCERRHSL